jgi:hypothetical protein
MKKCKTKLVTFRDEEGNVTSKKCSRCNQIKNASEFYAEKSGKYKGKLTACCKQCTAEKSYMYYHANKEKAKISHRNWVLKNKDKVAFTKAKSSYGIQKDEYDSLIRVCQICGNTTNLRIDHSHQSGRIRGMLCDGCNKGLGFFKDNPTLLLRASDYILGVADIFAKTYEPVEE